MPQTNEKISSRLIDRMYGLLTDYQTEVHKSNLAESSKHDYVMFALQFVRWVDDDFIPGGTLDGIASANKS